MKTLYPRSKKKQWSIYWYFTKEHLKIDSEYKNIFKFAKDQKNKIWNSTKYNAGRLCKVSIPDDSKEPAL